VKATHSIQRARAVVPEPYNAGDLPATMSQGPKAPFPPLTGTPAIDSSKMSSAEGGLARRPSRFKTVPSGGIPNFLLGSSIRLFSLRLVLVGGMISLGFSVYYWQFTKNYVPIIIMSATFAHHLGRFVFASSLTTWR